MTTNNNQNRLGNNKQRMNHNVTNNIIFCHLKTISKYGQTFQFDAQGRPVIDK